MCCWNGVSCVQRRWQRGHDGVAYQEVDRVSEAITAAGPLAGDIVGRTRVVIDGGLLILILVLA